MIQQVSFRSKAFPALLAFEGLLPGVGSPVLHQLRIDVEGLATLTALIWLLPSMDSPMLNEVRALDEAFPALVTLVWPLSWRRLLVDIAELIAVCPL